MCASSTASAISPDTLSSSLGSSAVDFNNLTVVVLDKVLFVHEEHEAIVFCVSCRPRLETSSPMTTAPVVVNETIELSSSDNGLWTLDVSGAVFHGKERPETMSFELPFLLGLSAIVSSKRASLWISERVETST
jgi:hypothetical protein